MKFRHNVGGTGGLIYANELTGKNIPAGGKTETDRKKRRVKKIRKYLVDSAHQDFKKSQSLYTRTEFTCGKCNKGLTSKVLM